LSGEGKPLPPVERAFFESRFGYDFSTVRIHDDARSAEAARDINARAFTIGQDVAFAPGEFAPNADGGRRLLAHELTHVVQQGSRQNQNGPTVQRKETSPGDTLDRVLRAARRARRHRNDRVRMLLDGSEIVDLLIDLYFPTYGDRLSGVTYDDTVGTIRAEADSAGTVSIIVGKKFILETKRATLLERTTEIATAFSRWESNVQVDPGETSTFKNRTWAAMDDLMTASKSGLRLLYERTLHAPVSVAIRSVTEDSTTWHVDEADMAPEDRPTERNRRSHTEPSDSLGRGAERDTPTASTIFVNPFRIKKSDSSYERGTFVHELVHALDLAYGQYNSDYRIRERRAVFFENMWRHEHGADFRGDYHGRFTTDDYQKAVVADDEGRPNGVDTVTTYLLSHSDLPKEGT
jgi:hypothetical protein